MKSKIQEFIEETRYIRRCVYSLKESVKNTPLESFDLSEQLDKLENDCDVALEAYRRVIRQME